jgi:hypothetical protein
MFIYTESAFNFYSVSKLLPCMHCFTKIDQNMSFVKLKL